MLPGLPPNADYDDPMYDEFWDAVVDLGLPPSFHILTSRQTGDPFGNVRGPRLNSFMTILRANQDVIGVLIFGAVFERHPELRVVCVEADAGWVPHWMYRADHAYDRHRNWLTAGDALEGAERVLPGARVSHVPGRLGRVPDGRPDEPRTPDVGERLPAQRRDVAAQSGDARRARRAPRRRMFGHAFSTTTSPSSTASSV